MWFPSFILEIAWLWGVQCSNCLTAQLVHACTGHTLIGEYVAWFHKKPSRCMCSHPHESVIHIIHICPLHMKSPSPGKCYQLVEFVRFLKKNPWAFEWLEADLALTNEWGTLSSRGRLQACLQTFIAKPSYPLGLLVVCHWQELTPDCLMQGWHSDHISTQVCMLPSSFTGGHPSPEQGRKIPISPTFDISFSDLVGTYWLNHTCT